MTQKVISIDWEEVKIRGAFAVVGAGLVAGGIALAPFTLGISYVPAFIGAVMVCASVSDGRRILIKDNHKSVTSSNDLKIADHHLYEKMEKGIENLVDEKTQDPKMKKVEAVLKKLIEKEFDMDTLAKLKNEPDLNGKQPSEEQKRQIAEIDKEDEKIIAKFKADIETEEKQIENLTTQVTTNKASMPKEFEEIFKSEGFTMEQVGHKETMGLFMKAIEDMMKKSESGIQGQKDENSVKAAEALKKSFQAIHSINVLSSQKILI